MSTAGGRWRAITPRRAAPFGAGVLAGALVLGPALGRGGLFNLDLVVTPFLTMPRGVWGLGPELPRRAVVDVAMAAVSGFGLSGAAWRALMLMAFGTAFAGAFRLARPAPTLTRAGAGLLFALSPFLVTRVAVGHTALVVAVALLPWALPTLARPGRHPARTFLWLCLFSLAGVFGGLLAASLLVCGLVAERPRNAPLVLGGLVVSQLPWVVPGLILVTAAPSLSDPAPFMARVDGFPAGLDLLAGHGFWSDQAQVGGNGRLVAAVLGIALLGLALRGHRRLPAGWRGGAAVAAAVGLAVPLAGATPGLDGLVEALTRTPVGAPLRDTQRFLPLYLVWMAPAAALGAEDLARRHQGAGRTLLLAGPLAIALVVGGPGLFGAEGRLEPTALPDAWFDARAEVTSSPGTVLALPWNNYLDLQMARSRRVHHPAPVFLGGDVLLSSDLGLPERSSERVDPREPTADRIVEQVRAGQPAAADLAALGVRWVFLLRTTDWGTYTGLFEDPGLELVVEDMTLALYRVTDWEGPVLTGSGEELEPGGIVPPLRSLSASEAATWYQPGQAGWRRGGDTVAVDEAGLLSLPAGRGPVWFWPALAVVAGWLLTTGTAAVLVIRWWRRPRSPVVAGGLGASEPDG